MASVDEVAELHRLSGRAMAAYLGEAPGAEFRINDVGAMSLTRETGADFNMLMVGAADPDPAPFLADCLACIQARGVEVLALLAPRAAEVLASALAQGGLRPAGTVPLMVLRGGGEVRLGRPCRIEKATDPGLARVSADLLSAAFGLPRDAVGRVFEPGIGPAAAVDVYIAFDDDTPMSTVTITRSGDTAGVWTMATPPERQGKGMGRALLSRVIARLHAEGVNRFYLFATQAGFPLYESLGFATLAEDSAWVKGTSTQTH